MRDRDIPGMGDYSPPDEPDWEKASENALIYAAHENAKQCVIDLREIAQTEHEMYYRSVGEDPAQHVFGDCLCGPWHDIYVSAKDALAEGLRLEKLRKQ